MKRIKFALQFGFFPKKRGLPTIPDNRDVEIHNIWLNIKQNNKRKKFNAIA